MAKKKPDSKEDSPIAEWKKKITAGERLRDKERDNQGWNRFQDYYEGRYKLEQQGPVAPVIPIINLVFCHVRTESSKLYFRDPYTCVNPRTATAIPKARLLEADVNYRKGKMKVKREVDKVLQDALIVGHGWMLPGYAAKTSQADEGKADKDAEVTGLKEQIVSEEIFAVHVPWHDVVFDIMSKDPPNDCRWIGYSFIKPLSEIKDSDEYENTAKLKANVSIRDIEKDKDKRSTVVEEYDEELVKLFRIFDIANNETFVVSLNHDKFLKAPTPMLDGQPLVRLAFNMVNGKPYPLSDIFLIESQILTKIKLRAQQLNHMKRWNRQLSIEKGAMEAKEKEKLEKGVDGAITERTRGMQPPAAIQYAQIQAEIFTVEQAVQDDMDGIIGQTAAERGQEEVTQSKTLGEAQMKQAGSSLSGNRRMDMLEDFIEEVDRKIIHYIQKYQDVDTSVPMAGLQGPQVEHQFGVPQENYDGLALKYNKSHVQGEDFDVDVKAGSSVPLNRMNRKQAEIQLVGLFDKLGIQPGGPVSQAVARELLRDSELKEAEKAFDEEVAMLKQKKEMQMKMTMENRQLGAAQIQGKIQSEAEKAHAATITAKAKGMKDVIDSHLDMATMAALATVNDPTGA